VRWLVQGPAEKSEANAHGTNAAQPARPRKTGGGNVVVQSASRARKRMAPGLGGNAFIEGEEENLFCARSAGVYLREYGARYGSERRMVCVENCATPPAALGEGNVVTEVAICHARRRCLSRPDRVYGDVALEGSMVAQPACRYAYGAMPQRVYRSNADAGGGGARASSPMSR